MCLGDCSALILGLWLVIVRREQVSSCDAVIRLQRAEATLRFIEHGIR